MPDLAAGPAFGGARAREPHARRGSILVDPYVIASVATAGVAALLADRVQQPFLGIMVAALVGGWASAWSP